MVQLTYDTDFYSFRNWEIVDEYDRRFKIIDGKALFENRLEKDNSIYISNVKRIEELAQYPTYKLSISMSGYGPYLVSWFGVVFGYKDQDNYLSLIIYPKKCSYEVIKVFKGERIILEPLTLLSPYFVAENEFKISVEYFNTYFRIKITHNGTHPNFIRYYEKPFGNIIGFITSPLSRIWLSRFIISRGFYVLANGELIDISKLRQRCTILVWQGREKLPIIWDGTDSCVYKFSKRFEEYNTVVVLPGYSQTKDLEKYLGNDITIPYLFRPQLAISNNSTKGYPKSEKTLGLKNEDLEKVILTDVNGNLVNLDEISNCTLSAIDKKGNLYTFTWDRKLFNRELIADGVKLGFIFRIPD